MLSNIDAEKISFIPVLDRSPIGLAQGIDSLAEELILEIERKSSKPVVGIGHSMGGTIVFLAANKRPELFDDIILLEPVLWGAGRRLIVRSMKKIGLGNVGNPAVRTLRRRNNFTSLDEARHYFSERRLFNKMDKSCFEEYMSHGLISDENGVKLAIPPSLESAIFECQLLRFPKEAYKAKGTIIHAMSSNTLLPTDVRWLKRSLLSFSFCEVKGGHMFPVEKPVETARLINRILKNSKRNDSELAVCS